MKPRTKRRVWILKKAKVIFELPVLHSVTVVRWLDMVTVLGVTLCRAGRFQSPLPVSKVEENLELGGVEPAHCRTYRAQKHPKTTY